MQQLPIIQSLWIGDRLSTMERLCISSFLYHGHSFHLYTYDHVENVPKGTIIKDANEIVPSEMIFKYKEHNSYAAFSDIFRYKLLFDKGSYWVDTDNVCLQPFTNEAEYIFSSERGEDSNASQVTNCGVIKVPKNSAVMEYCYNKAISKDKNEIKWGEIGPKLMGRAVKKFGLESYVARPEEFCAIDYWHWNQFIDRSVDKNILSGAQSVHLWNEMWRRNDIDKDGQFDKNSIYEWFKKMYLQVSALQEPENKIDNELVSIIIPSTRSQKMNKKIMVSICVMSYNLEKYIAEALNSILMQKVNFRYNIVVGEDCSTDNTRQILQDYANKYPDKFTLLLHEKNIGMLANFAATLKVCHGKYIALLDDDDYWTDPLKLQKQVDFLESNKDYSMVFHNIELHDQTENGVQVKPFNLEKNSREYTYDEIVKTWSAGTCSVLCINNQQYRYIEKNLWFPVQDLPFYLSCASMGKLYYMAETMSVYRRLLTGSQKSEKFKSLEHNLNFIRYLKVLYNDFNDIISKETIVHELGRHYHAAASKCKKNDDKNDYWQYLRLAMEHDLELIHEKEIPTIQNNIQKAADKNTLNSNLVSVIVPAFNVEKEISRCLDSIINQTYQNIEVIVVNDASTDKTRNIVEQYIQKDTRIICIDKVENEGLLQARMTGIKKANGEYIYSVDSDDYIMPDLVKDTLAEAFKHNADIVQFPMKLASKDSKYTYNWTIKKYQEYDKNNFFVHNGNSWTIMFKKELCIVLYRYIGSLSVNYHEDYIISIILSAFYKKVRYINEPYYVYCDTDTSMTRQYSDEAVLNYVRDTLIFTRFMTDLVPIIFPKEDSNYLFTVVSNRMGLMQNQLNLYFKESKNVNIYNLYNHTDENKTFIMNSMLYEAMQTKDQQLKQKDDQLKQKDTQLKQQDTQLKQQDTQLKQQDTQLKQQDTQLKQQDTQLKQQDTQLKQQDTQLKQQDTQLKQQDTQLKQQDTQLTQQDTQLTQQDTQLKQQQSKINILLDNRWYRFGQMSRKRKIWTIGKVVSKKIKLYWLLRPIAKLINKISRK